MYGKLKISADIHVLTGMHIGGSDVFSAIGAVVSPVIKDAKTQLPIIPGSSIKGKLRTLMARNSGNTYVLKEPKDDNKEIARLFGTSLVSKNNEGPFPSRLQFCDCFLKNAEQLKEVGTMEVKTENTIGRLNSTANPRQIERVIRGAVFGLTIIYDITNENEIEADFQNLSEGFKLLQMDYLGGHGTRGYGKVAFKNFSIKAIDECLPEQQIAKLNTIIKEVEESELLSV